jgi:uncharacterized membrane protein
VSNASAARSGAGWTILVTGLAGLVAAFVLMVEKIHLLEDPNTALGCDIGPFVACAPVMTSPAASLFGFPNQILGLVCFTIVVTTAVVTLTGARLPRWYWRAFAIGTVLAGVFITWLQYQSIFVIGSLCAWCMLVWAATIPLIVTTLGYSLSTHSIGGPALRPLGSFLRRYAISVVVVWYLLILGAIAIAFYDDFALLLN